MSSQSSKINKHDLFFTKPLPRLFDEHVSTETVFNMTMFSVKLAKILCHILRYDHPNGPLFLTEARLLEAPFFRNKESLNNLQYQAYKKKDFPINF
jgi:hypothetical protein